MRKILASTFFERPTLRVARGLLGKYLVRRVGRKTVAAMITDVEAYDGPRDKASHASRGRTKRNAPMFGPARCWYVYFTYGMHWLANIVTREKRYPAAVLIRGVKIQGAIPRYSTLDVKDGQYLNGPAKVTKFFKIDKRFNDKKASRRTGLWIEDGGVRIPRTRIKRAARIGVPYAGPMWAKKRYRFYIVEKKR